MKYKDVNWSKYDTIPSEDVFSDWVAMRKGKRANTTQTAINGTAKHINNLYKFGYTADDSFTIACENGWQGMKWVYENEREGGFSGGSIKIHMADNVEFIRNTRDIPIQEQRFDRSWALGINHGQTKEQI